MPPDLSDVLKDFGELQDIVIVNTEKVKEFMKEFVNLKNHVKELEKNLDSDNIREVVAGFVEEQLKPFKSHFSDYDEVLYMGTDDKGDMWFKVYKGKEVETKHVKIGIIKGIRGVEAFVTDDINYEDEDNDWLELIIRDNVVNDKALKVALKENNGDKEPQDLITFGFDYEKLPAPGNEIMKHLLAHGPTEMNDLAKELTIPLAQIEESIIDLEAEDLVILTANTLQINKTLAIRLNKSK